MRELARRLVRMRVLLMNQTVQELSGDEIGKLASLALLDAEAKRLPLALRSEAGMWRYVGTPVRNKINREGIVAQSVRGVQ